MAGVLVHEWIERIGGSENVLEALGDVFPDADVLCLWNNAPERFSGRRVVETSLARSPLRGRKALSLPLTPLVWRGQRNDDYSWALVSTHSFAHHVSFAHQPPEFAKLLYVHTPARYIWNPELDARGAGLLARISAGPFKRLDRRRAREAVTIAANSAYVAKRIEENWAREATVIHPPVDVSGIAEAGDWAERLDEHERELLEGLPDGFVLGASRLIPYKRLDLVIDAGEAVGAPVVIAGSGPEEAALRAHAERAAVPVVFVGSPSDALLLALFGRASVYVFPAIEDFGIMPVEAMAVGTPVVSGSEGGVVETVIEGLTGARVRAWTRAEIVRAVDRARSIPSETVKTGAARFSTERFAAEVLEWSAQHVRD